MKLPMLEEAKSCFSNISYACAVAAGKGGVGKSSVTVNLALAFKELGYKVGIIDADIYGPSIRKMLPEERAPAQMGEMIIPAMALGIEYISIAFFKKEIEANIVRAPIANAIIEQFLHRVKWSALDILFIDCPPGTGDILLTLMQKTSIHGALIVTTPQEVAVLDVRKSILMFQEMKVPILGVIENMSYFEEPLSRERHYIFGGQGSGGRGLAQEFSTSFLGEIPLDPVICECLDRGLSLFAEGGITPGQAALGEIAVAISSKICDHIGDKVLFTELVEIDSSHVKIGIGEERKIFRYSDLQQYCPCARCVDGSTGIRISDPERVVTTLDNPLRVDKIERVGGYALKFGFTSGCKKGIYTEKNLRAIPCT